MKMESPQTTISMGARKCIASFEQCLEQTSTLDPQRQSSLEDEFGRFSIWTFNIGVFAKGRASMDHRLREAPDVQRLVLGILDVLNRRVKQCLDTLRTVNSPGLEIHEHHAILARGELEKSVQSLTNEITLLHELSNTIRKASRESTNVKALNFPIRDEEGNDLEGVFKTHFAANIRDQFPNCAEVIRLRLASAMVLRRKRILYRRSRYSQAPFRTDKSSMQPVVRPPPSGVRPTSGPTMSQPVGQPRTVTHLVALSTVKSATTMPSHNFQRASAPSVVSTSKTVASGTQEDLVFPPPPQRHIRQRYEVLKARRMAEHEARVQEIRHRSIYEEQGGEPPLGSVLTEDLLSEIKTAEKNLDLLLRKDWEECKAFVTEVICPFCLYTLSSLDVKDERRWKNHVKNDLDPYVCLVEDCDSPDELYRHSDEWLKHMRKHAMRWRCISKSHDSQFFDVRDEYISHMRLSHGKAVTEEQIAILAERSLQPSGPLFKSCPLCGVSSEEKSLENHVIGHLRSLALKSLPRADDGDEEDEENVGNSAAARSGPTGSERSTIKNDPSRHAPLEFHDDHEPDSPRPGHAGYMQDGIPEDRTGTSWEFVPVGGLNQDTDSIIQHLLQKQAGLAICDHTTGAESNLGDGIMVKPFVDSMTKCFPDCDIDIAIRLRMACQESAQRVQALRETESQKGRDEDDEQQEGVETEKLIESQNQYSDPTALTPAHGNSTNMILSYRRWNGDVVEIGLLPHGGAQHRRFRCPACGMVIRNFDRRDWRHHLFSDLQPYICCQKPCKRRHEPFADRSEWIEHLAEEHRFSPNWRSIRCLLCNEMTGDGKTTVTTHLARHLEEISITALPTSKVSNVTVRNSSGYRPPVGTRDNPVDLTSI
ncbi:hypothetical protein GGR58DRAFT_450631 [Xylaria digitata]|nr:hypothetical protein GGR58DRAFT_450631 [Xylaria digitata]